MDKNTLSLHQFYFMKQTILFCSLLVCYAFAISQDFYISLNNKVVPGTIQKYKEWAKNPSSILFKDSITGNNINLTPASCKRVVAGVSDNFMSYSGTRIINTDKIENTHALQSNILTQDTIHVFLRQIYQFQNYALYKLLDDKRTNFYLAVDGVVNELEYFEYLNEDKQIVLYEQYKNHLLKLFADKNIDGLVAKINILSYKENNLINFFADILNDKGNSTEQLRNKYPLEILAGIGANATFGTITRSSVVSYNQTTISPSFDIGLRVYSQRNFGKLFFQPSVNITSLSQSFNNDYIYKTKATLVSAKIGAGYFFQKKPALSVYGALQGGLTLLFGYKTQLGAAPNQYIKEKSTDDKATLYPEIGILINQSLNIALTGMLPIKVPLVSDHNIEYKINQVNVIIRYVFINGNSNKK